MTAFGNYTLRDNQDIISFIYYSKKMGGGGGQMPLLLPPGYANGLHKEINGKAKGWEFVLIQMKL